MQNTVLEAELQGICTFRRIIADSNQKIQNRLLRKKLSIQLVQQCYCTDQKNCQDQQLQCAYDDKTTDYFSESDHQTNQIIIAPSSHRKDHYLTNYLNQYETNRLEFSLGLLREKEDFQNSCQNYMTPVSSREKGQFKSINFPVFENVRIQSKQSRRSNSKIQKKDFDQNVNVKRIVYDDFVEDNRTYYAQQKNFQGWGKIRFASNISRISQNERKFLKASLQEKSALTSKKQSENKIRNITSTNKKTNQKNAKKKDQKKDLNHISLRIMKRVQLSSAANKSAYDSYLVVYKKEQKERSQIIDKIVSQYKELKKTQKKSASLRKQLFIRR